MKKLGLFLTTMFFALAAFAQDAAIPTQDVITALIELIGGWKGLTSLAAALAVVQLIIKFLSSEIAGELLKKVQPQVKFLVIQGLSVVVAILTLKLTGVSGTEAVIKVLAMPVFLEFAHKIYVLYIEKKQQ